MPPYTNISKPTGANYTNVSPVGKQVYDDANTTYDSAVTTYDGIESGVWINVAKPGGIKIITVGMATGLIIPLTYGKNYMAGEQDLYVKISKPT